MQWRFLLSIANQEEKYSCFVGIAGGFWSWPKTGDSIQRLQTDVSSKKAARRFVETTIFLQKPCLLESEVKSENFRGCFLASGRPRSENMKTASSWIHIYHPLQCDSQSSQPYCRLTCYAHPAHNFIWDSCPRSSNLVAFWITNWDGNKLVPLPALRDQMSKEPIKERHKCSIILCIGLILLCVLHSHNNQFYLFFSVSPLFSVYWFVDFSE